VDELKTTSPRLEKDFGKTRDGQKMVLSVTVCLSETCGLRDRQTHRFVTFTICRLCIVNARSIKIHYQNSRI